MNHGEMETRREKTAETRHVRASVARRIGWRVGLGLCITGRLAAQNKTRGSRPGFAVSQNDAEH